VKEEIVANINVQSWYLPAGTNKNLKTRNQEFSVLAEMFSTEVSN
jgi:hypothetical protein